MFSEKKYNLMHFERQTPYKMHQIIFSPEKIIIRNMCAYPIYIFKPITQNTLIFYLALFFVFVYHMFC